MRYWLIILLLCASTLLHAQQGGYSNPGSAAQGDSIKFYISTSTSPFTLTIYRIGQTKQTMLTVPSLTGVVQTVLDSAYWYGCNWNVTYAMKIPTTWTSGLYTAEFPSVNGTEVVPFVVRQKIPGSTSKLAVNLMTNTFAAFDNFGGKSLYEYNSTSSVRSYKLSFNRPYGFLDELKWLTNLIKWLESQNIAYECLTDGDMDIDTTLINNYDVLALAGHEEYLSMPERAGIERLVNRGGRLISLSANTCYWQVRLENNGRTLVCYKWPTADPLYGINNSVVTYLWSAAPVNDPEVLLFGANSYGGGSVNSGTVLPASQGYGDYAVTNSQQWIYQGTGLLDGSQFGTAAAIVGDQTDGVKFTWSGNGTPAATGVDQAPMNYRILGISPASDGSGAITGHGTMGLYFTPGGGVVFNGATINFTQGLVSDATVQKVAKNLFTRFISNKFPPDMTAWSPARVVSDSVNHDFLYENKRDTTIRSSDVLPFSVTASDPRGEAVTYRWLLNGAQVATSSTYNFSGSNGVPGMNAITALVFNSHDTSSITWAVTVNSATALPAPILLAPANAAFHQLLPVVLQWGSVSGAILYRLQISSDPSFASNIVVDATQSATTYSGGALQYSTTYYWRVSGSSATAPGTISSPFSFTTSGPPLAANDRLQGGYTNAASVLPGDSLRLYISTPVNPFTLTIYRTGKTKQTMLTVPSLAGVIQSVPDSAYWYGCAWNVTYAFKVPATWTPGLYTAEFPSTARGTEVVPFIVRSPAPGSTAKLAVAIMTTTWQAYNNFAGKSLYEFNSTNLVRTYKVSFDRPYGTLSELIWPTNLIQWLENQNIAYEVVADNDLDADTTLLSNYNVLALAGHEEYWSKPERTGVEKLVGRGGGFIALSGDNCGWQVRFENNGRMMTCYKWPTLDPLNGINNSLVTYNWYYPPVNYPEELLFGAGTENGGYVNNGNVLPKSQGYGDFAAFNTQHWIFQGTGLKEGQQFGWNEGLVGYEADGARYAWSNGLPVPTGTDQAPLNYRIFGFSPTALDSGIISGHSTMGMYFTPGGGAIFNAATVNWAAGLVSDPTVQQITNNVFTRFIAGRYPPEITAWAPVRVVSDTANRETIFKNMRDTSIQSGSVLPLSITATDPKGETVQYLWKVNNATAGTSSSLAFNSVTGIVGQNTITAFAFNSHDTASISWNITVTGGSTPAAPVLLGPANGATGQPIATTLRWRSASGAALYRIQVSTDSTFATITVKDTLQTDTLLALSGLQYAAAYYWRVNPSNFFGAGPWSSTWHFTTTPAAIPVLASPLSGATNQLVTPILRWHPSVNAASYHVQLSTNSGFPSNGLTDLTLSDTAIEVGTLKANTVYYWRALASNGSAASPWSGTWNFKTINQNPPGAPSLASPANKSTGLRSVVTLKWKSSGGATSYRVEVASDSLFRSGFKADSITKLLVYTVDSLALNTAYFWRVAGISAAGRGAWSLVWKLTTGSISKAAFPQSGEVAAEPTAYALHQNYPNPFNPTTTLSFALPGTSTVRLQVYNIIGQLVATLLSGETMNAGEYSFSFNGNGLSSGMYYYRLSAQPVDPHRTALGFNAIGRMILAK